MDLESLYEVQRFLDQVRFGSLGLLMIIAVLVPQGCLKAPKIGGLKQQKFIDQTALEARNLESECHQGQALSDGPGAESFLSSSSFWCMLVILSIPLLLDTSFRSHGHLLPVSLHYLSSVFLSVPISPFHKDNRHVGLGPTLMTSF